MATKLPDRSMPELLGRVEHSQDAPRSGWIAKLRRIIDCMLHHRASWEALGNDWYSCGVCQDMWQDKGK